MEVRCPSCQATLALPDSAAGKRALCPSCDAEFRVSGEGRPAESLVRCPACNQALALDPSLAGQKIICPSCQRRIVMPAASERASGAETGPFAQPVAAQTTAWNPLDPHREPAAPQGDLLNPYAASSLPHDGSAVPLQRVNYIAPGVLLALLSGASLFGAGLTFIWILLGLGFGGVGVVELVIGLLMTALTGLASGFAFAGAMQMIRRRRLDLARLGAWAALFPCGFCSVLQIPFAIWALVILYGASAPADFGARSDAPPKPLL